MLFDAQHGRRRRGTGSCEEKKNKKKHILTLNSRGFPVSLAVSISSAELEPTRVVDRGHLNSAGGQGGLGLEPVPFKC